MHRNIEKLFFILIFMSLAFYLLQPERRALTTLYGQKIFLYMNRNNAKVFLGRDFVLERAVFRYGENVVLQPGDIGIAPCSLSYGYNVLFFSVKRTLGIGKNPKLIVLIDGDTLAEQEVWSEEWMYVKAVVKISEQKINSPHIKIICQRKCTGKDTKNLILSKLYIIKK